MEAMKPYVRQTGAALEVQVILWPEPGNPETKWVPVETMSEDPTHEELAAAKDRVLADPRYFARCGQCGALRPRGWMHDEGLCLSCAQGPRGLVS